MNLKFIEDIYDVISNLSKGASLYKMDLHIHQPASKCYKMSCDDEVKEYI